MKEVLIGILIVIVAVVIGYYAFREKVAGDKMEAADGEKYLTDFSGSFCLSLPSLPGDCG